MTDQSHPRAQERLEGRERNVTAREARPLEASSKQRRRAIFISEPRLKEIGKCLPTFAGSRSFLI